MLFDRQSTILSISTASRPKMKKFTEHPNSVDESYGQHLVFANSFGLKMIMGGLACCIHGLFPWMFECKGSETVRELHKKLEDQRSQLFEGEHQIISE